MSVQNELARAAVLVACCLLGGARTKPSFPLGLPPGLAVLDGYAHVREERDSGVKAYSGNRVQNDSLRMVYYHEQTVGIVELGPKKLLLNCELIEVYDPEDATRILSQLQEISRPLYIKFSEMMDLMQKCQLLDSQRKTSSASSHVRSTNSGRGLLSNNPFTLFSGIIPGTKWCGTGDIADNYHDLGAEASVDRCCRTHDLCPVKVRAYTKRYNLTNGSLYTKSHCQCDDGLFDCLKTSSSSSPSATLMGNVYFNLVQVPCVEDVTEGARRFRAARSNF